MEAIFVPVTCPSCQRRSALTFDGAALKGLLNAGDDIPLRCAYDDVSWTATPTERGEILKLCEEQARVSASEFDRSLRFALGSRAA